MYSWAILQHSFFFLTMKFGKIKWRFISCNRLNFSLSSLYSLWHFALSCSHYNDVIMGSIASQITSLTIVYSRVYSGADQRKHEGCASLAFVRGIHRRPVNSPHKGPVTRKMVPFDDVVHMCGHSFYMGFWLSIQPVFCIGIAWD